MRHAPRGPVKSQTDPIRALDPMRGPGWRGCVAKTRRGTPCKGQAISGGTVCRMHGGAAPQVQAKAHERLMALQPKAIQVLDSLLNRDEFPTVQMAAVRDVLDRTEGKAVDTVKHVGAEGGPVEFLVRAPWRDIENP